MRHEDWAERLADYLAEAARWSFKQGLYDCGHFAAGAVEAMTGVDHLAPYKGRYESVRGYLRLLKDDGYDSVGAFCTAALGEPISVLLAQRGDVVMTEQDGLEALGVCNGQNAVFLSRMGGLVELPMADCSQAWRVA